MIHGIKNPLNACLYTIANHRIPKTEFSSIGRDSNSGNLSICSAILTVVTDIIRIRFHQKRQTESDCKLSCFCNGLRVYTSRG